MSDQLADRLRSVTSALLDRTRASYSLRSEVMELRSIFVEAVGELPRDTDIATGETVTGSGVAISPTMASMCLDDFARTVQFIRGIHDAIVERRSRVSDRPVRILYAGCGPWATIGVPLMSVFSPDEVRFKLLDIHEDSIRSVVRLLDATGLADRVERLDIADASIYKIDDKRPDIIVIEMLRAALRSEPQVAVARNLGRQAPDAVMIPEEVSVDVWLVDASREHETAGADRDRVLVASIFKLDRAAINSQAFKPVSVTFPDYDGSRYTPMLMTAIRVHGENVLRDYDSGITLPQKLSAAHPGATLSFAYEAGSDPGLRVTAIS